MKSILERGRRAAARLAKRIRATEELLAAPPRAKKKGSKYMPHQGKKEMARRRRQMARDDWTYVDPTPGMYAGMYGGGESTDAAFISTMS